MAFSLAGCANAPFPSALENGNTYFTSNSVEPVSFDPSYVYDTYDDPITCLIYPSFFRFHFLRRNPFALEPNIGATPPKRERVMVQEPGGKNKVLGERWTFTLRKDLRFQDDPCFPGGRGRQVVAEDIVYGFKRMADPKVNCPVASYVADKIVGFKAFEDGFATYGHAQYDHAIPGIQVDPHDPFTFSITLNQPYPQLRFIMAMHFSTPQAREAVETYGDQYGIHHPVGCGLFEMKEYKPHQDVLLVRNPNAYDERFPTDADPDYKSMLTDAGKKMPFVDAVYVAILTEPVTSYNLFQQGYLDSLTIDSTNAQAITVTNSLTPLMQARGVKLSRNMNCSTFYIAFNMTDSVVGGYTPEKRKLRQAISLAIDSNTVIDLLAQGLGTPAEWLIPNGLFGYDPNYKNPYKRYDPNLTLAKKLLAEAGYPNGIDQKTGQRLVLHLDCNTTSPVDRETVRLYQKEIQALGIQLELRGTSYPVFDEKVRKRQVQLFNYSWFADYPDPENFTFLFYGPNESPGPDSALYHNAVYDKLFEQMRSMEDGPRRLEIIKKMRDISVEDCPWVYLRHSQERELVQPWAENIAYHPMDNGQLSYVRIDPEKRKRLIAEWNHPVLWPAFSFGALALLGLAPAIGTVRGRRNRRLRESGDAA